MNTKPGDIGQCRNERDGSAGAHERPLQNREPATAFEKATAGSLAVCCGNVRLTRYRRPTVSSCGE